MPGHGWLLMKVPWTPLRALPCQFMILFRLIQDYQTITAPKRGHMIENSNPKFSRLQIQFRIVLYSSAGTC